MINQEKSKKRIAILFGGKSSEYSVSLQSASAVIRAINQEKYNLFLIGIDPSGQWFHFTGEINQIENDTWKSHANPAFISPDPSIHGILEQTKNGISTYPIDAAFPILHGKNGEDGTIQGLLELAGIPCIGCGLLASALCMDKDRAHKLASLAGVKVPRCVKIDQVGTAEQMKRYVADLSYPIFVKPIHAGSSFGITKVTKEEELMSAITEAFHYDTEVILEEAVNGFEVGCAVIGKEELQTGEVDEIELSEGFFDFTEKYSLKTSKIHMPARIDTETANRIKQISCLLYRTLGCSGFARVDLFVTPEKEIYFNEINTIPGFTSHSRFPNMMRGAGYTFEELVEKLIEQGMKE